MPISPERFDDVDRLIKALAQVDGPEGRTCPLCMRHGFTNLGVSAESLRNHLEDQGPQTGESRLPGTPPVHTDEDLDVVLVALGLARPPESKPESESEPKSKPKRAKE